VLTRGRGGVKRSGANVPLRAFGKEQREKLLCRATPALYNRENPPGGGGARGGGSAKAAGARDVQRLLHGSLSGKAQKTILRGKHVSRMNCRDAESL